MNSGGLGAIHWGRSPSEEKNELHKLIFRLNWTFNGSRWKYKFPDISLLRVNPHFDRPKYAGSTKGRPPYLGWYHVKYRGRGNQSKIPFLDYPPPEWTAASLTYGHYGPRFHWCRVFENLSGGCMFGKTNGLKHRHNNFQAISYSWCRVCFSPEI